MVYLLTERKTNKKDGGDASGSSFKQRTKLGIVYSSLETVGVKHESELVPAFTRVTLVSFEMSTHFFGHRQETIRNRQRAATQRCPLYSVVHSFNADIFLEILIWVKV